MDESQARQFLERGFVVIRGCFSREAAAEGVRAAYARMGYDPAVPKTWKESRVCLPPTGLHAGRDFAPKAWSAIYELVGGKERLFPPELNFWPDTFIVKFPRGAAARRVAANELDQSWHKDGGPDTPHYLDSAETGLISFMLWTDLKPKGGGTFLACDSVAPVARHLAAHPKGALFPGEVLHAIIRECRDFVELTGKAGDVALVHPFMLHTESDNVDGPPRFQSARMFRLKEPMRFDRGKPAEFSLVERAVLRALGKKSFSCKRR